MEDKQTYASTVRGGEEPQGGDLLSSQCTTLDKGVIV